MENYDWMEEKTEYVRSLKTKIKQPFGAAIGMNGKNIELKRKGIAVDELNPINGNKSKSKLYIFETWLLFCWHRWRRHSLCVAPQVWWCVLSGWRRTVSRPSSQSITWAISCWPTCCCPGFGAPPPAGWSLSHPSPIVEVRPPKAARLHTYCVNPFQLKIVKLFLLVLFFKCI